jgi:DNA repair photolyase
MLNKSRGNMYGFVTHTWNVIKGKCYHDCSYCYMKRFKLNPVRFDEKELKTDLGKGNFIFVGSSCDMFNEKIPNEWIDKILKHCESCDNKYLFQTKNPDRILDYIDACVISDKSVICTTIETNRYYKNIMRNSPPVDNRVAAMRDLKKVIKTYLTIEPIIDFDLNELVEMIIKINPDQLNIGADSGGNNLPEPSESEIKRLIYYLNRLNFKLHLKPNLKRILQEWPE